MKDPYVPEEEDPTIMINYNYNGRPYVRRSGGSYPSCDFWDFIDIDEKLLDTYMIPDTIWREKFIKENFTE